MRNAEFSVPNTKLTEREEAALPSYKGKEFSPADKLKQEQRTRLMAIEGVEGVGIGQDALGNEAVVVYVRDQQTAKKLPATVSGMKVVVEVTGPINALGL